MKTVPNAIKACKSTTPITVPNVPIDTTATLRKAMINSHHSRSLRYPMYNRLCNILIIHFFELRWVVNRNISATFSASVIVGQKENKLEFYEFYNTPISFFFLLLHFSDRL